MNLKEFESWALKQKSVANPEPDNGFLGECVSLVQQYLYKVCGMPFKARGNAKDWVNNIPEGWDKLDISNKLKAGDILVYTTGKYGHMVIVDANLKSLEQNKTGSNRVVTVGDIRKGYACILRSRKAINIGTDISSVKPQNVSYKIGNVYKTQVILKVRANAGTNYAQKSYNELTTNAKANAYNSGANSGCLKVGTKVTCQEVKKVGNDTWIRIPSGWIAAYYNGKTYVS